MSFANPWFIAAVLGVLAVFHLELLSMLLNLARLGKPLPPALEDVFPEETRQKTRDYITDSSRVSFAQKTASLGVLIGFWWSGGFGWLQKTLEQGGHGPVATGVAAIAVCMLAQTWLNLPFAVWDTFGVEARHGFNRTTPGTFISDHFKSLALMAVIGVPIAAAVVWLFETQSWAPFKAWAFMAVTSVVMTWLAPRVLMPLFLKFQPLQDGSLKEAIFALAEKLQFPVAEVSIVDGSTRSSKANAFFAGFGKTRRIALYDTLLEKHTQEEILAILAHEIGHNKRRHVPVHLALGLLEMGLVFLILAWALNSPGFFAAFGVEGRPVGMGLVLLGFLYSPIGLITGLAGLAVSRKHEFEADAFAAQAMGSPAPLNAGLKKLSTDHLSHPQPHPLAIWLHYSHPPLSERLAALERVPV